MTRRFLLDTSALARFGKPQVRLVLQPLHVAGLLAVCGPVAVEVMHSARSAKDAKRIKEGLSGFDWLPSPDEVWDRALEVQAGLITKGTWRGVPLPDLIVAATAERHSATVLHYDADFELISAVTGQPHQWVVPAGTAD